MYRRSIVFGLLLTTGVALALAGCGGGGGGPQYDDPIVALGGGATKDISQLNGTSIYTMVTPLLASKPEGNSYPPATLYSFVLTASAGRSLTDQIFNPAEHTRMNGQLSADQQAAHDLKMREAENRLLASRARQLSGRPTDPDRAPPKTITVGTKWNDVNIYIAENELVQIDTTCRYVSDRAYFFVDDRNIDAMEPYLDGENGYGAAFDSIYDVNHAKFGTENDTDGNGKVIVVFTQELVSGTLGYFYAVDKFSSEYFEASNEGDIFYITTDADCQGDVVKATLAHEFQHMIYFDEHYDRGVIETKIWLNEALSQAAEYYNGYLENHHGWIARFLYNNNDEEEYGWLALSLTHWTVNNYGYGAVFIRYLIDQYGDAAIGKMCATNKVGIAAVEAATGRNFNTIFTEFTRALVMSGASSTENPNPRYRFTTLDLQAVQPRGRGGLTTGYVSCPGYSVTVEDLPPYSPFFIHWSGEFGTMNLSGSSIAGTVFGLNR